VNLYPPHNQFKESEMREERRTGYSPKTKIAISASRKLHYLADLPPQTEWPAGLTAPHFATPDPRPIMKVEKHDTTFQMLVHAFRRRPDDPADTQCQAPLADEKPSQRSEEWLASQATPSLSELRSSIPP